ncbi:MAG TPA: trypsin-like peptidase domain-containing protein [Bacillota bacterium]|nr:trypsin-like peptidase domain-containing protein [Bacillota bacterium]
MGYYDEYEHPNHKKRRSFGLFSVVITAFLSAALGGMMVLQSLPTLVRTGFVHFPASGEISTATSVPVSTSGKKDAEQTVNVKVETDTVKAVRKVEKAVVGIINIQKMKDLWSSNTKAVESGTGSGVVFSKNNDKALIVTNYHVIKGASDLEVSLPDTTRVKGRVLGADPLTDLAVLEIPAKGVDSVAELGSSSSLQVGEPAIAIGNPLGLHFSRTVTQGIISSLNRSMPVDVNEDGQPDWEINAIQTDAAINPGNSGGALINAIGKVIGINSLKISETGVEGLGFAIPIDDAKPIIDDLVQYGKVKRPYLGIVPKDLQEIPTYHWQHTLKLPTNVTEGIVVIEAVGSAQAGLKPYDVITALDDQQVSNSAELRRYMYTKKQVGQNVKVTFYRDGKQMSSVIALKQEQ